MPASCRWLPAPLAALAVGLAACGGGGDDPRTDLKTPGTDSRAPAPTATPTADPEAARVIRAWADTLRRGDVAGAARYFALPSTVSNGTPAIKIKTRAAAVLFNRALPCGARVIKLAPTKHGFVFATFRLTERPGAGSCGSGAGGTARTAMRVRNGRITDWLRVPDEAPEAESTTRS